MQTAERPQHAPDHLQSQTVKLRKLIKEQRVDRPEKRREERFTCQLKQMITKSFI